jgi:hypothetical protein
MNTVEKHNQSGVVAAWRAGEHEPNSLHIPTARTLLGSPVPVGELINQYPFACILLAQWALGSECRR